MPPPPVGRGCPGRLDKNGADTAGLCTLEAKGCNGTPHPPTVTDGDKCFSPSACGSWAYGSRTAWWAAAAAGAIDICTIALRAVAVCECWGKGNSASLELLERRLVMAAAKSNGALPRPPAARPPPPMAAAPGAALATGGKSERSIAAAGGAAAGVIAGDGASEPSDPLATPAGKGRSSASRITARCCASRTSPCMNRQRGPYGQRPVRSNERHAFVLYDVGWSCRARRSSTPWANWHLWPYGHVPARANVEHSSVL